MKYGTLVASVPVFQSLVSQPLPLRKAYQMSVMVRKINEELEFFRHKRDEILGSDMSEQEKNDKMDELLNLEIDWQLDPLELSLDDDVKLSASDLDMAEGLIKVV